MRTILAATMALMCQTGFSANDCTGKLSIDSQQLWTTPVVESYTVTASRFFGLNSIVFETVDSKQSIEYDFCEVFTLSETKMEYECFGNDDADYSQFPFSIGVLVETKSDETTFTFTGQNKLKEGVVKLNGPFDCAR